MIVMVLFCGSNTSPPLLVVAGSDPEGKYEALEKYGIDLTEMAKQGKLDPVIGRDEEIRRCIQILCQRTKNNPVSIGEPGVGKTAIVEGLVLIVQCLWELFVCFSNRTLSIGHLCPCLVKGNHMESVAFSLILLF
jgi:hypothetical protein